MTVRRHLPSRTAFTFLNFWDSRFRTQAACDVWGVPQTALARLDFPTTRGRRYQEYDLAREL
jgi:hypothetical protein